MHGVKDAPLFGVSEDVEPLESIVAHLKDEDEVALDKAYYVLSGGVDMLIRDSARNVSARNVRAPLSAGRVSPIRRVGVGACAPHCAVAIAMFMKITRQSTTKTLVTRPS